MQLLSQPDVQKQMILALALVGGSSQLVADEANCVKLVFNNFCLGGNIANVTVEPDIENDVTTDAENTSQSLTEEPSTQKNTYLWRDKTVLVEYSDEIIVAVTRLETPGTWLNYTSWKTKIVRQYGRGEDRSTFPAYATSRSSRLNALNSGRGFAAMAWPQSGWQVEMLWRDQRHIELRYSLDNSATDDVPVSDDDDL